MYNPSDATNEKSDKRTPEGGLRSEGGMTYAGLKSFLYAGVGKDDPRVKAAVDWIRRHYTLDENPGQGDAGLYYYYHMFAKAMDALGEDQFADAEGGQARLAEGAVRDAEGEAGGGRELGEQERPVPGEHAGAGDGVRAAVAELHDQEVIGRSGAAAAAPLAAAHSTVTVSSFVLTAASGRRRTNQSRSAPPVSTSFAASSGTVAVASVVALFSPPPSRRWSMRCS